MKELFIKDNTIDVVSKILQLIKTSSYIHYYGLYFVEALSTIINC